MTHRAATPPSAIAVAPFEPSAAAMVVSWVADDDEFWFLSPETEPPATAAKVIAWGAPTHRQWLFRTSTDGSPAPSPDGLAAPAVAPLGAPFGYVELNDMPNQPAHKWIGHLLLDPAARGRSVGVRCVRRLIRMAFDEYAAEQVLLVVVPSNQRAVRCYARAGFEQQGEEWKQRPRLSRPYRLLRMGMTRERFTRTRGQFVELDD